MEKVKILITVEGGICQSVCTNCEAEIVIVDYDKHSDERVVVSEIKSPDLILKEDQKFYEEINKTSTDPDDLESWKKLKKLNF